MLIVSIARWLKPREYTNGATLPNEDVQLGLLCLIGSKKRMPYGSTVGTGLDSE